MKFLPLVWATLWRKRARTILTMLSIAVAFLLYGLLQALSTAFNSGIEMAGADRLVTASKYSITQILPYADYEQIKSVPGVKSVTYASWFGGVYQDERNFFPQFAVDAATYLEMYPEFVVAPEQKKNFLANKTACLVGKKIADRFGWKVGDRIPIQATIWPRTGGSNAWDFELAGTFSGKDAASDAQTEFLMFHHDYFDDARQFAKGTVGWYIIRTADAARNAEVARAVDQLFRNSPSPTKTDSEKAFNASFIKQMGDIGLIVRSILGAVFFTLVMLTGNTMMQSVRERIPELAVLKTLGFSGRALLGLVLSESVLMFLVAATLGLVLAGWMAPGLAAAMKGALPGLRLTVADFATGAGLAVLLGLGVGALPALRALRLDIVAALTGH